MVRWKATSSSLKPPVASADYNHDVDTFREKEYPMLKGKTYLDHGGTTLYAASLIDAVSSDLRKNLFGNPHSASKPSELSSARIDEVRERVLRFFNADPQHYDLVFCANASAAIKLVAECFADHSRREHEEGERDTAGFWYGYHRDAHNSLVGVRELVGHGKAWCFRGDHQVEDWISGHPVDAETGKEIGPEEGQLGLFAYPGQSNMTGRRLPLSWPAQIRQSADEQHKRIYTLLDAAALATTAQIDLSDPATSPDFVAVSFYKIFGYPDLGGLIVRNEAAPALHRRRYFGGGTVDMVINFPRCNSVTDDERCIWFAKRLAKLHDALEDGTLPFHSIITLGHALDVHKRLYGSMSRISAHSAFLIKHLHAALAELKHQNGKPVVKVYSANSDERPAEKAICGDAKTQGATLAMNLFDPNGKMHLYDDVERAANAENIYIRSGALCNPGGMSTYLEWSTTELHQAWDMGHRCSQPIPVLKLDEREQGRGTGVVRVGLGAMSNWKDIDTFVTWVKERYVNTEVGHLRRASISTETTQVSESVTGRYKDLGKASFVSVSQVDSIKGDLEAMSIRQSKRTRVKTWASKLVEKA